MKQISLVLIFLILTISGKIMAQSKDSVQAKKVAESGATGDIILGKQNKKTQLSVSPQRFTQKDSLHKEASIQSKKKKIKK